METKNIFLFGATGQTGRQVLQQALDAGHKVTVLARSPEALDEFKRYDKFEVKKGNVLDKDTFEEHMAKSDVVMSCLGSPSLSRFSGVTIFTESFNKIHEAMNMHGIRKFIGMSSWATKDQPDLPFFLRWILRPIFLKSILENLNEMEQLVEKTELNYTIVRPPGLSNEPLSGKEIAISENGQYIPGCTQTMPRADVGAFMLQCLLSDKFDKKIVAVGLKG